MQTGIQLVQEQKQQLVMTPELRQALSVLQYNVTELNTFVMEQVTENPVLDWDVTSDKRLVSEGFQTWSGIRYRQPDEERGPWWENVSVHQSLQEQMEEQLRFLKLEALEKKIAKFLLGHLDERGYLNISIEETCKRFNVEAFRVKSVLRELQQFEPAGIFARDLQECLLLQVERMEDSPPLLKDVVTHYLPQLADGKWQQVAKVLNCTPEQLQHAVDWIRKLDPNPGLQLVHDPANYVIPDVIIEEINGEYVITINDPFRDRLRVSPEYEAMCRAGDSRQVRQYLTERFQAADWLFRSLESRRQTLFNITRTILEYQEAFFKHGLAFLRPMTLQDVAQVIGVHESTVSRAIRNKYLQTPRGLIFFKTLFSSGLQTAGGEGASREQVKQQIKQMVKNENKANPYSDQQLANELKEMGVKISRRTVAKYREELMIPPSAKRKRFG